MATRKSFKGYVAAEPVEFDLEPPNGSPPLTVRGVPSIPGATLLDFLSSASTDDPSTLAAAVRALLKAAVVPDQWDEFDAFVRDPNNGISLDLLSEISGWLGEAYSGRPTSPQAPSTPG